MTHYYDEKQKSPENEEKINVHVLNKKFELYTASGLFSKAHLDIATKLLIEKCDLTDAKKVLDLGCGWGPVSVALKSSYSGNGERESIQFFASDVNERAVKYTRKNVRKYNLDVVVKKSDILKNWEETFDVILTNPPYAAGRKICYAFIEESFDKLNQGGSLQLVARHQKGGKMLAKHMEEIFGNVEGIAIKSGFRIYKSVKE